MKHLKYPTADRRILQHRLKKNRFERAFPVSMIFRETGFVNVVMLFVFAFGMNLGVGVISTLDHSVYTACVGSLILAVIKDETFCLDALLKGRRSHVPPEASAGRA